MFSRRPKVERGISAFFVTENPLPEDHPAQSLATASLLRGNGPTGPAGRAGSGIVEGREQNEELVTPSRARKRHGDERHYSAWVKERQDRLDSLVSATWKN